MKYISLAVALFLFIPAFSQAETVLRTGTDISVEADQMVEGDYYVSVGPFGQTVMSGSVKEDMYAFGATVTINGDIGNDLSIIAGTSQLHASVTDDVRIIAGEVIIAENVGGDVFVLAGSLAILSTANIAGDVFFFGRDLIIDGDVAGSVLGKARTININSRIGKDFDMEASSEIVFGDDAVIDGSVSYTSFTQLVRGQGTVINGEVNRSEVRAITARENARGLLIPIFITLFATLSLYLMFKRELESIVASIEATFAKNLLIGSACIFLGPIAAVLLIVTVLGLFIGLITLSLVILMYVVGLSLSSVVLGAFVMKSITKKLEVNLISILVGTVLLQLLIFIPVIGPLTIFVIFALTVGALAGRMYKTVS